MKHTKGIMVPMRQIKAVIHDIDGNLTLTEEACWHLENEVYALLGLPPIERTVHRKTWGMKLDDALPIRSNNRVDKQKFWELFSPKYDEFVKTGRLDTIAKENIATLKQLHEMGLINMLLTSRRAVEMSHYLNPEHVLHTYVDAIYYFDNMKFHKPDPRAFAHIESEHSLKPEECVYVGDQPGDAAAAKGAGLHFVANLEEGIRTREDFADYPVDAFVQSFTEIPVAILGLINHKEQS